MTLRLDPENCIVSIVSLDITSYLIAHTLKRTNYTTRTSVLLKGNIARVDRDGRYD